MLRVFKEGDELHLQDDELDINCTYDGNSFSGKGSRKYRDKLETAIRNFTIEQVDQEIELLANVQDDYRSDKYQEIASLQDIIGYYGDVVYRHASIEEVYKWQNNPVRYNKELRDLAMYYYGQKGIVMQTINMLKNLHNLNSNLKVSDPNHPNIEEDMAKVREFDKFINKKTIIRDILFDTFNLGTCIYYNHNNKWIQTLDLDLYLPKRLINGRWEVEIDMIKLTTESVSNIDRYPHDKYPQNLKPNEYVNEQPDEVRRAFDRFRSNPSADNRYYKLNISKTGVIKLNSRQNDRYGRPYAMSAFDDLFHKEMIREAERSVINRIVDEIMVLKLGESGKETDGKFKPNSHQRKVMYDAIKQILYRKDDGYKLLGIPWWAELDKIETDFSIFNNKKHEEVDSDILTSLGVQMIFNTREGSSYQAGQLNLNVLFSSIFSVLEQIEQELFNYNYRLLVSDGNDVVRVFNRSTAIDSKDKIAVFTALKDIGGALKPLLDEIGYDFGDYITQAEYEQEVLRLPEKFKPYQTSYTTSQSTQESNTDESEVNPNAEE